MNQVVREAPRSPTSRTDLVHPWPLLAVALLAVNDHVLKASGWVPGWMTGKLSDFAGMFFFPVLLTVLAERLGPLVWTSSRPRVAASSVGATGAVFALVKSSPAVASWLSRIMGTVVADPTDLLAVFLLIPSYLYLVRHVPRPPAPLWARRLAVLFAGLSSMATSQIRSRHGYALWETSSAASWTVGCAGAEAWVSKSGKTGMGLTLRLTKNVAPCSVSVEEAVLSLPGSPPITVEAVLSREMTIPAASPDGASAIYLPFVFDNEHAWNAGITTGVVRLRLKTEGEVAVTQELALVQRYEGYHVQTESHGPASVPPKPMYRAVSPAQAPPEPSSEPESRP